MRREEIRKLLPIVYQRCLKAGTPIDALLHAMEGLHAPSEEVLDNISSYFDSYSAPEQFVRYLAGWVDLDRYLGEQVSEGANVSRAPAVSIESGRLRELIAMAADLSRWRGTARGLKLFLETATGIGGFDLEEQQSLDNGLPRVFHFRVTAPAAATRYRDLIETIINGEKPAYATHELNFVSQKEASNGKHSNSSID